MGLMEKAALVYLEQFKFSVIPINPANKKAFVPWTEYQKRLPTREEIIAWWIKYPDANVGIVTGKISDLAVIDIDEAQGYEEIKKYVPETLIYPVSMTP